MENYELGEIDKALLAIENERTGDIELDKLAIELLKVMALKECARRLRDIHLLLEEKPKGYAQHTFIRSRD